MSADQKVNVPWMMPRYRNWVAVAKVHAQVEKAMTAGLLPLGLKLPHYDIMANVHRFAGLTQQELATKLLVGRSNLSMLLPELERRGLIERTPDKTDKRLRRLHLTSAGTNLVLSALKIQVTIIEEMMEALTVDECDELGDFMRRVGAHMAGEKQI